MAVLYKWTFVFGGNNNDRIKLERFADESEDARIHASIPTDKVLYLPGTPQDYYLTMSAVELCIRELYEPPKEPEAGDEIASLDDYIAEQP